MVGGHWPEYTLGAVYRLRSPGTKKVLLTDEHAPSNLPFRCLDMQTKYKVGVSCSTNILIVLLLAQILGFRSSQWISYVQFGLLIQKVETIHVKSHQAFLLYSEFAHALKLNFNCFFSPKKRKLLRWWWWWWWWKRQLKNIFLPPSGALGTPGEGVNN